MSNRIQITRPCLGLVPGCRHRLTDKAAIAIAADVTAMKLHAVQPWRLADSVGIVICRYVAPKGARA